jgi:flavin-dependent thymidylate synthase
MSKIERIAVALWQEEAGSMPTVREMTDTLDTFSTSIMTEIGNAAFNAYRELLARDVPRELARSVLPVSTYSHMFATVNLLNLFKFLSLRDHEHAQWEIQQYAQALAKAAEHVAPVAFAAWRASHV